MEALCLPSINVSLNLPGLQKVAFEFKSKGYKLADCFSGDSNDKIDNMNLIFGSISNHIVPVQDVIFGKEHTSAHSNSPLGVLLKADVSRLLTDLPYLPSAREQCDKLVKCCFGFSKKKDNSDSTSPDDYTPLTVDDDYELSEKHLLQLASNIANYAPNCIASGKDDQETHELNPLSLR